MNLPIEPVLFLDPQGAKTLYFCPECGRERYSREGDCPLCGGGRP